MLVLRKLFSLCLRSEQSVAKKPKKPKPEKEHREHKIAIADNEGFIEVTRVSVQLM